MSLVNKTSLLQILGITLTLCLYSPAQGKQLSEAELKENLQSAPDYILLGQFYLNQERVGEAVAALEKAASLSPYDDSIFSTLGQCYLIEKNWSKASQAFEQAIELNPKNAALHFDLGHSYRERKMLAAAKKSLQKALELEPTFLAAKYNLALVHEGLEEDKRAEKIYRAILKERRNFAPAHLNLGKLLAQKNKIAEAQSHFQKSLANKETLADGHYNLALLLQDQGKYEQAVESYQQVLRFEPDHAQSHNNLGVVLNKIGRKDKSLQAFKNATTHKPDFAAAFYNLALAHLEQNNLPQAGRALEALNQIDPNNQEVSLLLATVLEAQNDVQGALEIYKSMETTTGSSQNRAATIASLELAQSQPALARQLMTKTESGEQKLGKEIRRAQEATEAKDWQQAIEIYEDLHKENPESEVVLILYAQSLAKAGKPGRGIDVLVSSEKPTTNLITLELGHLYLAGKEWQKAQKSYQKVLRSEKNQMEAYMGLADLAYALNDAAREQDFLEKALEFEPNHLDGWIKLGKVQHAQGKYAQALKAYRRALKLAPNSPNTYYIMGFTLERLGKKTQALAAFEKVLKLRPDDQAAKRAIEKLRSED